MSTANSVGHEEGQAWLPLVVDCGVCQTTHALAIGDRGGCPFEGSQRAALAPGGRLLVPPSDGTAGPADRSPARFLR